MGNHNSSEKGISITSKNGGGTIITDGSFKNRRRSHNNRKSRSKDSPNNQNQVGSGNSGSGGDTSSADTANPEGTSTKSASCDATKIDAQKLLEKFNVKPPPFEEEERELVIESWVAVEQHIAQIGLTSYLEMFKRAPESLSMFPFLKHLSNEDLEFYSQLRDHAVRVTGVLSMMIRQLERDTPENDEAIRDFLLELGRRHFGYGAMPRHMELLGCVFVESLQPVFVEHPKKEAIHDAWFKFFRFITFWLTMGFKFVQNRGVQG